MKLSLEQAAVLIVCAVVAVAAIGAGVGALIGRPTPQLDIDLTRLTDDGDGPESQTAGEVLPHALGLVPQPDPRLYGGIER